MNASKHLQFLLARIVDINVALFHCETDSVLKLPTAIINTHSVDADGTIYFFIPRPKQLLCEFEKQFPVGLNYFKKGVNHYMNIHGFARIINDAEELLCYDFLSSEEMDEALNRQVLVKVKILKVDYYENDLTQKNILFKIKSFIYNLLAWVEPQSKSFDFSTRTQQIHNYGF